MQFSKILNHVYEYMEPLVTLLDFASASIILWGFILGFVKLVNIEFFTSGPKFAAYQGLRRTVGIYIILGLEFMVVSDLLHTIRESRDYKSIIILGAMVAIRTVISYFLGKEMKEAAEEEKEYAMLAAASGNKPKEGFFAKVEGNVKKAAADVKKAASKKKDPKA